jgi:hypothetical protein
LIDEKRRSSILMSKEAKPDIPGPHAEFGASETTVAGFDAVRAGVAGEQQRQPSDPRHDGALDLGDPGFVAFEERPLLDPFGIQQSGLRQDSEMLADRRLGYPSFSAISTPQTPSATRSPSTCARK